MASVSVSVSDIPKKKSKGRRKILMERIQDRCKRHVAFSRRRTGLFKKAGELSSLCGSEVAVIVFSEAGKAFTCGYPNADSVIHRYLLGHPPVLPSSPVVAPTNTSTDMAAPSNTLVDYFKPNDMAAPSSTLIDYFNSPSPGSQSTDMAAPSTPSLDTMETDVNTSLRMM